MSKVSNVEAARALADEIFDLNNELNKAEYIMQELSDDYFRKYQKENEKDRLAILWDFDRRAAFSEVLGDILVRLVKTAEYLNDLKKQAYAEHKEAMTA